MYKKFPEFASVFLGQKTLVDASTFEENLK